MKIKTTGSTGLYLVESKDKAWKDLDLLMHLYTTLLHTTCWEGYADLGKSALAANWTMDLLDFFGQPFFAKNIAFHSGVSPKSKKLVKLNGMKIGCEPCYCRMSLDSRTILMQQSALKNTGLNFSHLFEDRIWEFMKLLHHWRILWAYLFGIEWAPSPW